MPISTLTKTGRAALAFALSTRPLHLAWGSGDPAWDAEDAVLPSLVEATALVHEVGRRTVSSLFFVEQDDAGDIVIPLGLTSSGVMQSVRYRRAEGVTPNLYVSVFFDYEDAANAVIREAALFSDTETLPELPPGQRYFTPDQLANPGKMIAVQILQPAKNRSASVRESMEFVLPI